jgi:hypothetical protein
MIEMPSRFARSLKHPWRTAALAVAVVFVGLIIPRDSDKPPKVWSIHDLRMGALSLDKPMTFSAALENAVPPGAIETSGTFGPWGREEPGQTPLEGKFTFEHADLGVFKGISGILSAVGTFGGALERIEVHGVTDTPDFTVTAGGHPCHSMRLITPSSTARTATRSWKMWTRPS